MMECTTGLTDDEFDELLAWLRQEGVEGYPSILGLSGSSTCEWAQHGADHGRGGAGPLGRDYPARELGEDTSGFLSTAWGSVPSGKKSGTKILV